MKNKKRNPELYRLIRNGKNPLTYTDYHWQWREGGFSRCLWRAIFTSILGAIILCVIQALIDKSQKNMSYNKLNTNIQQVYDGDCGDGYDTIYKYHGDCFYTPKGTLNLSKEGNDCYVVITCKPKAVGLITKGKRYLRDVS